MATTGGKECLQRGITAQNQTIQDLGSPLTQRGDTVILSTNESVEPVAKGIENPTEGNTGMFVLYHNGTTIVSAQVKAAVTPPVGALLLYIEP